MIAQARHRVSAHYLIDDSALNKGHNWGEGDGEGEGERSDF